MYIENLSLVAGWLSQHLARLFSAHFENYKRRKAGGTGSSRAIREVPVCSSSSIKSERTQQNTAGTNEKKLRIILKFTLYLDEASDKKCTAARSWAAAEQSRGTKYVYNPHCSKYRAGRAETSGKKEVPGIQQRQPQYTLPVDHSSSTDRRHDKERSKFLLIPVYITFVSRLKPRQNVVSVVFIELNSLIFWNDEMTTAADLFFFIYS